MSLLTGPQASILSDLPGGCKSMKFSTSLVVSQLSVCLDKEKELLVSPLQLLHIFRYHLLHTGMGLECVH